MPATELESRGIVVIGSSSIDVKGRASRPLQSAASVAGEITVSFGGVGRNVAENLARLGQRTVLLSAVGHDPFGAQILEHTSRAGVDMSRVIIGAGYHSASYVAILDQSGSKVFAVDEMTAIMELVTPGYIHGHRGIFRNAPMVFIDANLSPKAMRSVVRAAKRYGVPVAANPTSRTLARRLREYLPDLYMLTPNVDEAGVLCGHDIDGRRAAMSAAQELVSRGVGLAIITLGDEGLCYASSEGGGYIPAIRCEVVDLTGAGDALSAAVVYGLVNGFPIDEAMRLGVSAAALTIRCSDTVCSDLSLERLYDQLVI